MRTRRGAKIKSATVDQVPKQYLFQNVTYLYSTRGVGVIKGCRFYFALFHRTPEVDNIDSELKKIKTYNDERQ